MFLLGPAFRPRTNFQIGRTVFILYDDQSRIHMMDAGVSRCIRNCPKWQDTEYPFLSTVLTFFRKSLRILPSARKRIHTSSIRWIRNTVFYLTYTVPYGRIVPVAEGNPCLGDHYTGSLFTYGWRSCQQNIEHALVTCRIQAAATGAMFPLYAMCNMVLHNT